MFRRRTAVPPPDLAAALDDLRRLAEARPDLRAAAETLGRALAACFGRPEPTPPPLAERPRHAPEVRPDPALLHDRADAIASALRRDNAAARALRAALREGPSRVHRWGRAILAGEADEVEWEWRALGLDAALAAAVLRLAWLPALAAWSPGRGKPAHDDVRGGPCPFCEAPPLLAEARGLSGARVLRCGRCAAEWPAPRLACYACGEDDHDRLRTAAFEGQAGSHRLQECRSCGCRLRVTATLARLSAPGLLVAELETAHLEAIPSPDD